MSSASALPASSVSPSAVVAAQRATAPGPSADRLDGYGEQSFSFSDFLSIINPLQHIPIVGTIYRAITGDTLAPAPRVIGGLLFGGPFGMLGSAFNAIIEQTTGKDLGDQVLALFTPSESTPPADAIPQIASETTTLTTAAAQPGPPAVNDLTGSEASPASPAASATAAPAAGAALPSGRRAPAEASPVVQGAKGLTLADYRAAAGQPLAVIDGRRMAPPAPSPMPLKASLTTEEPQPPARGAARSSEEAGRGSPSQPESTEPTEPFVAAMMRGLDRYREMKLQQQRAAPAVLDTSL